jgi:hypothetical protein
MKPLHKKAGQVGRTALCRLFLQIVKDQGEKRDWQVLETFRIFFDISG